MKLVAVLKMLPTAEQAAALKATLERCNAAATWLAQTGFDVDVIRQYDLHKLAYAEIRFRFELTAQATVRTISKVADAFKTSADAAPIFKHLAAQPYDDRILRFTKDYAAVNLWVLTGRISIPIVMGEHQRRLMAYRKGEVDLCFVRGNWILAATCDVPETEEFDTEDWIGCDLGIVALLADSDGRIHSGGDVESVRLKIAKRRGSLQQCGTKAAKRRLKNLAGKQRRYQQHVNHVLSKELVRDAERTARGIGLENLKGIRSRVSARNSNQRARLGNWSFGQLGSYIVYKSKRAGVPVAFVDPRYTSQQCSVCGCIDKRNRPNQSTFKCMSCGHTANADKNAAVNIRQRALAARGVCNAP